MLPVLAAIVMIPQVLFWWLAPVQAAARLAVYIGGTLLTVAISATYGVTYWHSNLRKTAGLFVVCSVFEVAVLALAVLLLGINASVRTAIFAFVTLFLVCIATLVPLVYSSLKEDEQETSSAAVPEEQSERLLWETQNHNSQAYSARRHNLATPREANKTPLPPRNH